MIGDMRRNSRNLIPRPAEDKHYVKEAIGVCHSSKKYASECVEATNPQPIFCDTNVSE